jgi:hypothetical protein
MLKPFVLCFLLVAVASCKSKYVEERQVLPHSMKGFEMYSWNQDGHWFFSILPGTNRNKSLQEIQQNKYIASCSSSMENMEEVERLVKLVPANDPVMWMGSLHASAISDHQIRLAYPPTAIINAVKKVFAEQGRKLEVITPK